MKATLVNVLIGAAFLLAIVYLVKNLNNSPYSEGFADDTGKTVFAAIFGGGAVLAFVGFMIYAMTSGSGRR